MLAACDPSGGSTVWCVAGRGPKDRACVSLTLGCAGGEWFPAFTGGGSRPGRRTARRRTRGCRGRSGARSRGTWHPSDTRHPSDTKKVGTSPLEAIASGVGAPPRTLPTRKPSRLSPPSPFGCRGTEPSSPTPRPEMIAGARAGGKEWDASGGGGGGGGGGGSGKDGGDGFDVGAAGIRHRALLRGGLVPLCRLGTPPTRKKARGGGGFDDSAESSLADGPPAGAHRMSLRRWRWFSRRVAREKPRGGGERARHVRARRRGSRGVPLPPPRGVALPEGRLLPMGGGRAHVGLDAEGEGGGWGAKSKAAIERGLADARRRRRGR